MPEWIDANVIAGVVSAIVTLFVVAQAGMLLPYRVGQLEKKVHDVQMKTERSQEEFTLIRQELAILRRDIEWMVRIMARETGVEIPPLGDAPNATTHIHHTEHNG